MKDNRKDKTRKQGLCLIEIDIGSGCSAPPTIQTCFVVRKGQKENTEKVLSSTCYCIINKIDIYFIYIFSGQKLFNLIKMTFCDSKKLFFIAHVGRPSIAMTGFF